MAKIYWRNGWAWARKRVKGVEIRDPLGTTSPREAQKLFDEWLTQFATAKPWQRLETPFEKAVEMFEEHHLPTLKPGGAKRYIVSLLALTPHFQGKSLQEITKASLAHFVTARRRQGLTSSTIRRDLACLSSVFTIAEDFELCDDNPVLPFLRQQKRRGALKEAASRTRYLSHDEEAVVIGEGMRRLAKLDNQPKRKLTAGMILAAIIIAIDTGLRSEELLALEWMHIDLDGAQLVIPAARAKSGRERTVPLQDRSLRILRNLPRHGKSPLVIWHANGIRFYDLNHALQKWCAAVGVTGIRWHDLRRTCGCRLLQDKKLSMKAVSEWLGHASVVQTEGTYAFLSSDDLHEAVGSQRTIAGTRLLPKPDFTGEIGQ